MEDYRFFDEILIPPRGEISVRISFENARVSVRFYDGSRARIRPGNPGDPLLRRLAQAVRGDGTISVENCLSFLATLEEREDYDRPPVTVETEVYFLTPVEPPACPVLNFIFDGNNALTPLMQDGETLYSYDGQGVFVSENGRFFSLPETALIDPYLNRDRVLPAMAFSMFFRRTYPLLEKEEKFRLYSSLHPVGEPPLKVSPRIDGEGKLVCTLSWCVPYPEIRFFPEAGMICECRGELRPTVPAIATLPRVMQNDGALYPDRMQYTLLLHLSRAMPSLFSDPLPAYPASSAAVYETAAPAAAPIPPRAVRTGYHAALPYPAGADAEIIPTPPVFSQRGASLERFLCYSRDAAGEKVPIVPFSAFSPDWSQMKKDQRDCYLYLRRLYLAGEKAPEAGYAYLLLLIYEAVNLPDRLEFLFAVWEQNREKYRRLDMLMPALIRDYIVLYQPETPLTVIYRRVKFDVSAIAHPELYLDLESEEGLRSLPPALLTAVTGYDVMKSRFYSPETAPELYDAFTRAFVAADRVHRKAGKGLFGSFRAREILLRATACGSAVMTSEHSAELVYRYTTAFYDPALREELALLMKCAENELRIRKGFSGRLRVTGLSGELADAVREELREKKAPVRVTVDIREALSIEENSWNTTDKLIAAAGSGEEMPAEPEAQYVPAGTAGEDEAAPLPVMEETAPAADEAALTGYGALVASLGEAARGYLRLLSEGADEGALLAYASSKLVMPETLEEEINEKASEYTGDILIENGEIIEDYRPELPPIA